MGASGRIPQPGERWRFVLGGGKPDEDVMISRDKSGRVGFMSASVGAVTIYPDGTAGIGRLELPASPPRFEPDRSKQHDEITLDEWRHKLRSI